MSEDQNSNAKAHPIETAKPLRVGVKRMVRRDSVNLSPEACDYTFISDFREKDYTSDQLREMGYYESPIAALIRAAEAKGVRLNEVDLMNGDVECPNDHVVIFRGDTAEFLDRIFEGGES